MGKLYKHLLNAVYVPYPLWNESIFSSVAANLSSGTIFLKVSFVISHNLSCCFSKKNYPICC